MAVKINGTYGRGLTAIDYAKLSGRELNVDLVLEILVLEIDTDRVAALLRQALIAWDDKQQGGFLHETHWFSIGVGTFV